MYIHTIQQVLDSFRKKLNDTARFSRFGKLYKVTSYLLHATYYEKKFTQKRMDWGKKQIYKRYLTHIQVCSWKKNAIKYRYMY